MTDYENKELLEAVRSVARELRKIREELIAKNDAAEKKDDGQMTLDEAGIHISGKAK